jgi:hypothetical protein
MPNRTKISRLLSAAIRDIKTDEKGFLIKVHSKRLKRSFWIAASFDGLYDENGNEFEADVEHMPTSERAAAGIKSGLSRSTPEQPAFGPGGKFKSWNEVTKV